MKICFVAPGEISIPPIGHGALETATWFQSEGLKKLGYETFIVNEKDTNLTYQKVKEINPDIIHLNYGRHWEIMPYFLCRKIVTSYDGSFKTSMAMHDNLVRRFFYDCEFFCITNFEKDFIIKTGISPQKIKVLPSGVATELFSINEKPLYSYSICVGKIDERKNQHLLQYKNLNIKFVGQIATDKFDKNDPDYLGVWNRDDIYQKLTNYSNLILLSKSELQPFVCLEALSAGLGLVLSEACMEHLDGSLPFISVIPDSKLEDYDFIQDTILKNKLSCLNNKKDIIQYSKNFDWKQIVLQYEDYINEK